MILCLPTWKSGRLYGLKTCVLYTVHIWRGKELPGKKLPVFRQNIVSDILGKAEFLDYAVCMWHIELDGYSFQFE